MIIDTENLIAVPEIEKGSCTGCEFADKEGCLAAASQIDTNCGDTNKIFISKNKLDEYNKLVSMLNESSMLKCFIEEKISEVIQ